MGDIRFRLATAAVLSLTAFSGPAGTLVAGVWWIMFGARETFAQVSWKQVLPVSLLAAGFSGLVLILTGSDSGMEYTAKIFIILLIAFWVGAARKPGEFLDLGVWALGNRIGFDLGLVAELSMQFFAGVSDDLARMRTALRIKDQKLSMQTISSFSLGVLLLSLARAKNVGSLLARRGYHSGGTYTPSFSPGISAYLQLIGVVFPALILLLL